jgi:hypothetical protein
VNPFQSLRDYEAFVYSLLQTYPAIVRSTLLVARRGRGTATLTGELVLASEHRLVVFEILTWDDGPVVIQHYGYEVWLGGDELYWYDSQPHPNEPALASTHPHHKHILPDIKHHRIPAPGLDFVRPNLPFLIEEIQALS